MCGEPPQGCRLCLPEGTPHFLFETPKRKCAVHGGKEKVSGMSWPLMGQLTHTKERPIHTAGKIQKSPAGCADRCSSNNCVPASVGAAFIGVQRGHPLPPFPLPLPLSLEGFPKGRNRSFAPLCRFKGGAGGNRNSPAFLFRGLGGHSLFKREYPPGFSVPKRYSSAGNSGPMWEHHITPARRTAPRCCCPLSLRQ